MLRPLLTLTLALPVAAAAQDENVTVSHGFSNFGELKYGPDFPHLDYVNPDAPKGGEMSIWSQGTFDSFNQYARQGNPAALNTIGVERIMGSTADDPYGDYCLLCVSVEYPEDREWVIFNLRDDVTFADGTPMTAEDVKFTHQLFIEQGIPEYRRAIAGFFGEVEVLGPHRIRFTFGPEAEFNARIGQAGATPVFSQAWFEETGTRLDESQDRPFMSTGPYVLDDFDYNRRIVYARNPDYWGYDHPLSVGQYNFDRIRIEYFTDASAAFQAFQAGEYTYRIETEERDWATGYNFPAVQRGDVVREEIPDGTVGSALGFVFNLDREKWQDARVRDAIAMMFNFEWSNETLFYGLNERSVSFWPGTELAATGTPSEAELEILQPLVDDGLLPESILTDEVDTPVEHDPSTNRPSRGVIREASRLLNEAGWEAGDDGVRRKDGQVLSIEFLQFNPSYDRVVNPYVENLQALGIDARLNRIDRAEYIERRRSGNFDVVNQAFQFGFVSGTGLEQWFGSEVADSSSRNIMRLRNEAVDRIIPIITNAETLDDQRGGVHALDRVLRHIGFRIPQWYDAQHRVAYWDYYRHPQTMPPLALGYLSFWWHDAEAYESLRAEGALR